MFQPRCLIVVLLITLCVLCTGKIIVKELELDENNDKTNFSLEEFFNKTFSSTGFNGTWLSDHTILYKNTQGDYLKYDLKSKNVSVFIEADVLANYSEATITVSKDEYYVLINYNVSTVFRHSQISIYTIYSVKDKRYYHVHNQTALQLASFAPVGHGLAYVYKNNIYYVSSAEHVIDPDQVTIDGKEGMVYCGVPDWVYEEDILASRSAMWFSPDARRLAYAKFDDTNVKDFYYDLYGTPGSLANQYPQLVRIKYPKVGTPNPVVDTFIYDIDSKKTKRLELPKLLDKYRIDNDYILNGISWISDSELAMLSTNRIQNEAYLLRCRITGQCKEEAMRKEEGGWIIPVTPKYNLDGTKRLDIVPMPENGDRFDHLQLTDIQSDKNERLTYGNRVVNNIYGWDEPKGQVFYSGTVNDTPSQQHVYAVNIHNKQNACLTCDLVIDRQSCQFATATFSPGYTYYVRSCHGPGPTHVTIQNTYNSSDSFFWTDNEAIKMKLSQKKLPKIKKMKVPLGGNFTARVKLILPPNLDENSDKKYPAIVNVYAGPGSNKISDQNSFDGVENYWVTQKQYIYIYIDGRGSGRDGLNKQYQVYRKLGTIEIEDQIFVTKYLRDHLPYIDSQRIGIWGWSYGGFATVWTLVKDTENVFKFGLSVAPVTSFIYYDSIYTERYMSLPSDNELGYNNTDVSRRVERLRGKHFFLIHGTGDDNVHYQQSMLLSRALELADILFMQQSYTDENHSLLHVRKHLYHTIDRFFDKYLK